MNDGSNRGRTYGMINQLKNSGSNVSDMVDYEKLTPKERKRRFIKSRTAREHYRKYGKKDSALASLVFQEAMVSLFAILYFGVFALAIGLGAVGFIIVAGPFMGTLLAILFISVIISPQVKRVAKRLSFRSKLKKMCEKKGLRLYFYGSPLASLYRPRGRADFAVETGDILWEVMFFPAPSRVSAVTFGSPEYATVATRILKSRITLALGSKERLRRRDYRFEAGANIKSKKVFKVLLLNPVPYLLKYYDAKDKKIIEGGSGIEFFGYCAYSGSAFINIIERTLKD